MSLQTLLEKTGRFPPITLQIKSLEGGGVIAIDSFINYTFDSSVVIPVDTFSFTFVAPDSELPLSQIIKEGDIATLFANDVSLAVGIIDSVDIETDMESGERVVISGRDLLAQLEDHSAVSFNNLPIYAQSATISQVLRLLVANTRISDINFILQDISDSTVKGLLASEPSESKLTTLQRFLEPFNILAWMSPSGKITVGKPFMFGVPEGTIIMSKASRTANCQSIKAVYAANNIPNVYVPINSGQENTQHRLTSEQIIINKSEGPLRLKKFGSILPRTVVWSYPDGDKPQNLSDINKVQAAGGNILQAQVKREMARDNFKAFQVQAFVPGHYNDKGDPYMIDTSYRVIYDRGGVDKTMYLYQVQYSLDLQKGQQTRLFFCDLGTIVADNRALPSGVGGA